MKVYLDYNATTPTDTRVLNAMSEWSSERFGNASSRDHSWGWDASEAVARSRDSIADAVGVDAMDVVLMSGATEALNTVIRSYVGFGNWQRKKIVTCATEHEAVLGPAQYLTQVSGVSLEILSVNEEGHVDLAALRDAVEGTKVPLVALMAANNEIGTIHPIREIAEVVHAANGLFLCDTTQAFGKFAVDIRADGIDFATVSSHKIHGPKGVGALLVRRGLGESLEPLLLGGGQERGIRAGTLNVPGIVGLGEACHLVQERLKEDALQMGRLRDRLEQGILSQATEAWVNGDRANRLCNTSNIGFKDVDARTMIHQMLGIAVSTRSACSSGNSGASYVLKAIGLSNEDAYSCIRFSIGRLTTQDEIDYTINKVVTSSHTLRRKKSLRM